MSMLVRDDKDGIIVPIPQYPLYSALVTLTRAALVPYYLDEERNWGLDAENLIKSIEEAKKKGVCPRAIVVINPGNPTGQVMSAQDLAKIIKICYENNILILADEVYQTNIYKEGAVFVSMRKVLNDMGAPYNNSVEMVSFHSISKGLMGECGLRGGYFETYNLSQEAEELVFKLKSIELCSNTIGQTGVELMVNPPRLGAESKDTVA
jgi:aspartate/methionine/tyrosine aminotransferase